ncbi:MAG: SnoaL-like domain-containing protein [Bacteroidota bacterium]|nr:nuclear transport factor 2 family protein [Ferruginibacter sp.]
MTIHEIADRLVQLCARGQFEEAQKELFADDAVSLEPYATPAFEKETRGLPAIQEKIRKFNDMVQTMHNLEVSPPLVATESFAVTMRLDVTMKEQGKMDMTELCLYKVKDGKIISEEFFI